MGRKKKGWVCNNCEVFCSVYKKGKHRLIWCPSCDKVLAHNPLPLVEAGLKYLPGKLKAFGKAKGLGKLATMLPGIDVLASSQETAAERSAAVATPVVKHIYDSRDKPNIGERYVYKALEA